VHEYHHVELEKKIVAAEEILPQQFTD